MTAVPHIRTQLPGPRSTEILERARHVMPASLVSPGLPAIPFRTDNDVITDADGNTFIDFYTGAGVNLIGSRNPEVRKAIDEQLDHFWHMNFQASLFEPYVALAESVVRFTGRDGYKAVFFTTGTEAVENAIKYAQVATGRSEIICFSGSYHGRTWMAMSLTGNSSYKKDIGPFLPNVHRVPYPDCYRCPVGLSPNSCGAGCADMVRQLVRTEVPGDRIAAVIVEPVLGEGGVMSMPADFLQDLRMFCDEHGILLISDEIQAGFCRTGEKFSLDHSGVDADIYVIAKAFGGGLPIAGLVGRGDVLDAMHAGGVGGTYAGNPVACAAGVAAIRVIEQGNFTERARQMGMQAREILEPLAGRCELVGDLRIRGAMIGIDLVTNRQTKAPASSAAAAIAKTVAQRGVMITRGHYYRNVLRLLPPLTIDDELFAKGLSILSDVIEEENQKVDKNHADG